MFFAIKKNDMMYEKVVYSGDGVASTPESLWLFITVTKLSSIHIRGSI